VTSGTGPGRLAAALAIAATLAGCAALSGDVPPGTRWANRWEQRLGGHPQRHNLSCEARAACDLLAAHGIRVPEDEFLERLPRSDDPERGFVGDPDGPGGRLPPEPYGVHAPPVAATLRSFGLDARLERGRDLAWLREETRAGRPVLVWITSGCRPGRRERVPLREGRDASAVRWEHAVLVVGESPGRVTYLDPAWGETRTVDDAEFDASWALFDRVAISVPAPAGTPTAP
jgi:uncharacterized protein YvpB